GTSQNAFQFPANPLLLCLHRLHSPRAYLLFSARCNGIKPAYYPLGLVFPVPEAYRNCMLGAVLTLAGAHRPRERSFGWSKSLPLALLGVGLVSLRAGAGEWAPIGPDGGNIDALAVDPQDSNTVYASAASGVFKSTDGGMSWARTGFKGRTFLLVVPRN